MNSSDRLIHCVCEHHKSLYQWFLLHQEGLLTHHIVMAQKAWRVFEGGLRLHLELENEYLFSSTSNVLQTGELRWSKHVYLKEHDKVLKLLDQLSEMLLEFYDFEGRKKRLALLEVLEKQMTFRHVLEHHEEREEMDALKCLSGLDVKQAKAFELEITAWQSEQAELLTQLKVHFAAC